MRGRSLLYLGFACLVAMGNALAAVAHRVAGFTFNAFASIARPCGDMAIAGGTGGSFCPATMQFGIDPALYQTNRHEAGVARRAAHRHI